MGIGMVQHFQDVKGESYTICFEDGKGYTADPSWKFIGEAHSQNSFCDVCRNYDQTYIVPTSDPVNHPEDEVTVTSVVNALSKLRPSEIHVYMKNDAMEMKVEVVFKK